MEYINKSAVTYFIPYNHPDPIFPNVIIGRFGDYTVFINSDDPVPIPHFHVCDTETFPKGDKFHCCIKIAEPSYLYHTGREDKLTGDAINVLNGFLNAKHNSKWFDRNWDYLLFAWDNDNSDSKMPRTTDIPDYHKL